MFEIIKANFEQQFGKKSEYIFTSPGRTELAGNHTDHQGGLVIAAAVDMVMTAAVLPNNEDKIRIFSEGFDLIETDIKELEAKPEEKGTSAAIVRGIAYRLKALGYTLTGFDAYISSDVLPGSGLSSSAAFENLIGIILVRLSGTSIRPLELAKVSRYSENHYFGKPCGLMDQVASACGNAVAIDFKNSEEPVITPINVDFKAAGYDLCIIDCGADHSDLTDEYAAVTEELKEISAFFGKTRLRDVPENEFYENLPELRHIAGDRAVMRAMHVFDENSRVKRQTEALISGNTEDFLELVRESGRSSWMLLQNIIPCGSTKNQALAFALAETGKLLGAKGAARVHGGGFAGTLQAFVPCKETEDFKKRIEAVLGAGKCHIVSIRTSGSRKED